jgi:PAS domain S-box-containing protein
MESLAEGVVIIDKTGTILLVNTRAEQMFGYSKKDLIGKPHSVLMPERFRKVHEEHQTHFFEELRIRPMGQLLELTGLRRDGSEVPLEISLSFLETIIGVLVLAFISDITERKQAEEKIAQLNADLSKRAASLEDTNHELEAFNYSAAHDLRQPLNIICGYYQVIMNQCGNKLDKECMGYLKESYESALRMNRHIDALLDFSRMGYVKPSRETVDLSALAHEVIITLKLAAPERQVDFRIVDGIMANVDKNLLRIVIENLLGNSWKFTGMQEMAVIEFGVTDIEGVPTYFVRDNGAGFDMTDADKLFLPFQRLTGARKFKGFGIGLATVDRIIRRHGGSIRAVGEPGKGATFFFTLSTAGDSK